MAYVAGFKVNFVTARLRTSLLGIGSLAHHVEHVGPPLIVEPRLVVESVRVCLFPVIVQRFLVLLREYDGHRVPAIRCPKRDRVVFWLIDLGRLHLIAIDGKTHRHVLFLVPGGDQAGGGFFEACHEARLTRFDECSQAGLVVLAGHTRFKGSSEVTKRKLEQSTRRCAPALDDCFQRFGHRNKRVMIFLTIGLILLLLAVVAGVIIAMRRKTLIKMDNRVVFTLSTIPSRIHHVRKVVEGLLKSSLQPAAVYLNIPYRSVRENIEYTIPEELERLAKQNPKFIINRCEDTGPSTKLFPTLDREPAKDTIIIIADDDEIYPTRYHEELIDAFARHENSAIGYRGFSEKDGEFEWTSKEGMPSVLEGYTGMVLFRGFFEADFVPASVDSACFFTDDIWICEYLARKGIARRTINGIPIGSKKGMGNKSYPMQPRNNVADMNPLSRENMGGKNRNCQCYDLVRDSFRTSQ